MCGVRARVGRCGCMLGGGGRRRAGPGRRAARTSFALFSISFSPELFAPCPRKTVKQHNRCFYWLTRDVAVGLAGFRAPGRPRCRRFGALTPAGPDFRYTKNSARPGSDFIYTNFSGGRGFPLGGDVEEIGNFQTRKIRSHGTIFLASPLGMPKIWYPKRDGTL